MKFRYYMLLLLLTIVFPALAQKISGGTKRTLSHQDTIQLHELIVNSAKPVVQLDGDGLIFKISGTPLQKLSTLSDILGFIPGLNSENGNIEVIGKGRPVIYLNGRQVHNQNDIGQIKGISIKEIKLINNPGAKYKGTTNAVIEISTHRPAGEGFSLNLRTSVGVLDYLYGKEQLDLNYRNEGLDIFATFEYNDNHTKGKGINIQNIWSKDPISTAISQNAKGSSRLFEGKIGFNYFTKSKNSFGIFYQSFHKPSYSDNQFQSILGYSGLDIEETSTYRHNNVKANQHLVDGYYSGKWGNWKSDVAMNLLWRNGTDRQTLYENKKDGSNSDFHIVDSNKGSLMALRLNLSKGIGSGKLDIGTELSLSQRHQIQTTANTEIHDNDDKETEQNIGLYAEYSRRFGIVGLRAGIRYEYTATGYFKNTVKMHEQSKDYHEVLPSFSISFPFGKTQWQLGYTRKYHQPLYSQLSSMVSYVNIFLYESGNPNLKPSYSNNLSLNFNYNWLMIAASWHYISGQIINTATNYNGSNITLLTKINSPDALKSYEALATIAPGMIHNTYFPMLTLGIIGQSFKIPFCDRWLKLDNPMGLIQLRNIIQLSKSMVITAGFNWRSASETDNISMGSRWQIDLSFQKAFGKHWNILVSANDILNSSCKNHYTVYSGIQELYMEKTANKRSFEICVTYKFNTSKTRYKGKGAANEKKDRLE